MERKYEMCRELVDALADLIKEEQLPIEVHQGKEYIDCHGDRQVDVLLVCEDPDLVNDVLTDVMYKTFDLGDMDENIEKLLEEHEELYNKILNGIDDWDYSTLDRLLELHLLINKE